MTTAPLRRPLLALLLAAATLAACAAPAAPPAPTPAPSATPAPTGRGAGDTLRLFYWQTPDTLNPHLQTTFINWEVGRVAYEPLATFDKEARLIPILAAEIPSAENGGLAPDGQSVTWRLRPGVKWSDGADLTADDVVFTYEFITNPEVKAASTPLYNNIASVEALDRYSVRVTFKGPNGAWAVPFVGSRGVILPRHAFADYANAEARSAPANLQSVGTGPYRITEFKPQEVILLGDQIAQTYKLVGEINPLYRDPEAPHFRRLEILTGGSADEAAGLVLETGEVDYAWNLPATAALAELEALGNGRTLQNAMGRVERLAFNLSDPGRETADGERSFKDNPHPFFSDPDVRRAFAAALDRERIARESGGPPARLTSNLLVAPPDYASPNTAIAYDPRLAARLLGQAGWADRDGDGVREKDGRKLSVTVISSNNRPRQLAMGIIKENLEAVGVEVRLVPLAANILTRREPDNESSAWHFYADLQLYAYGNDVPDPAAYMQEWTCARIPQKANSWAAGFNLGRWCDPAYESLYTRARTATDPDERQALFIQMNDLLVDEMASIPIFAITNVSAASRTLAGPDPTPWDSELWNIQDWRRTTP